MLPVKLITTYSEKKECAPKKKQVSNCFRCFFRIIWLYRNSTCSLYAVIEFRFPKSLGFTTSNTQLFSINCWYRIFNCINLFMEIKTYRCVYRYNFIWSSLCSQYLCCGEFICSLIGRWIFWDISFPSTIFWLEEFNLNPPQLQFFPVFWKI